MFSGLTPSATSCCARPVFGQDGSFSFDALVQRYNSDLANGYGNLVSRTLTMIGKYFGGVVPEPVGTQADSIAQLRRRTRSPHLAVLSRRLIFPVHWKPHGRSSQPWTAISPPALPGNSPRASPTSSNRPSAPPFSTPPPRPSASSPLSSIPVIPDAASKVWAQLGLGDIRTADLKNSKLGRPETRHKARRDPPRLPTRRKGRNHSYARDRTKQ